MGDGGRGSATDVSKAGNVGGTASVKNVRAILIPSGSTTDHPSDTKSRTSFAVYGGPVPNPSSGMSTPGAMETDGVLATETDGVLATETAHRAAPRRSMSDPIFRCVKNELV